MMERDTAGNIIPETFTHFYCCGQDCESKTSGFVCLKCGKEYDFYGRQVHTMTVSLKENKNYKPKIWFEEE
jgi:hypothetical protein